MRIRRTKPLVLAFAASILLAVAAMLTLDLWWRHERAIAAAESRAANLTIALSEYVRSTFALADASLRQLVIHGSRLGGPGAPSADWLPILEATLKYGPATVLTNGMLLRPELCRRLKELFDGSEYSLDIRISLDGFDAGAHDAIRGRGVWDRVMTGIRNLVRAGLNPVITATTAATGVETADGRRRFLELIRSFGIEKPRLKVLSLFRIGAEEKRTRAYADWERLSADTLPAGEATSLQCASGRMVTSRGVYVCPILIEEPAARMGDTLADTLRPFPLRYGACHTWVDSSRLLTTWPGRAAR